jgi:hypothetical protein
LGRYDENTKPTHFQDQGKLLTVAVIALTAGGVGEQTIGGQFTFVEDGKTVPLKFEGNMWLFQDRTLLLYLQIK